MDKQQSTPTNFVATVYGNLVPLNNSALSKARLKIFYKGANRNGSYINDEIAEKLISTLPGCPIVGYFDGDKDDFLGHIDREANRAYGFVPQEMNFKWEMSLDPDGVYRTYACTDVILWTGRYPIASRIVGKSHSMELNPDTIEGEWVEHDDNFYFEFSNAEFIGLCVLGEDYEPCFEGSSFYELHKDNKINTNIQIELKEMYSLYNKAISNATEIQTGGQNMEEENQNLNNTSTPEETIDVNDKVQKELEKEIDNVDAGENSDNVEEQDSEEVQDEEKEDSEAEEEKEKENSEEEDSDDDEEKEDEEDSDEEIDLNAQLAEKDNEIQQLKAELESLQSYKAQKIKEEKENVLNLYSDKLTEEEVESFKSKMDSYASAVELKKDIALCILDKTEKDEELEDKSQYSLVNSQKDKLTGVEAIIAKYVKK